MIFRAVIPAKGPGHLCAVRSAAESRGPHFPLSRGQAAHPCLPVPLPENKRAAEITAFK
jgi:hypothetical protein